MKIVIALTLALVAGFLTAAVAQPLHTSLERAKMPLSQSMSPSTNSDAQKWCEADTCPSGICCSDGQGVWCCATYQFCGAHDCRSR